MYYGVNRDGFDRFDFDIERRLARAAFFQCLRFDASCIIRTCSLLCSLISSSQSFNSHALRRYQYSTPPYSAHLTAICR